MVPVAGDHVRGWPSGRASAFQADLHGFDSRTPLQCFRYSSVELHPHYRFDKRDLQSLIPID